MLGRSFCFIVALLGGAFLTLTVLLETEAKEKRDFPFPALRFSHRFQQRPRNNTAIHFEAPPAFPLMLLFKMAAECVLSQKAVSAVMTSNGSYGANGLPWL